MAVVTIACGVCGNRAVVIRYGRYPTHTGPNLAGGRPCPMSRREYKG